MNPSLPGETPPPRRLFGGLRFDAISLPEVVARIVARPSAAAFAALHTPNAEFVYWGWRRPEFARLIDRAWLSTNDSRVLARVARWRGVALGFVPGAFVVRALFEAGHVGAEDPLTLIGGTAEMAALLRVRFGLRQLRQHVPPMGFFADPVAVDAAMAFVAAHPARFVFIAMGPPHSDLLAGRIAAQGGASGLGLCIGSALGTLVGLNPRTPDWMEQNGLVWLYRLIREPRRLWRRYLGRSLLGLAIAVWRGCKVGRGRARFRHDNLN